MMRDGWQKSDLAALKIALAYIFFGALWIAFTDQLLTAFVDDPRSQMRWGSVKGIVYFAVTGLLIFALVRRSIAESERTGEALRQSQETFRLLIEGVHDYAIYMLDAEGRVASWNEGAQRIKGYRSDEIIGRHFSCLYPPDEQAEGTPTRNLEEAARVGRFEVEGWRMRKDETRFFASVVITPLRDDEEKLLGFANVTRDITERRRAEEALRQKQQDYEALVNSIDGILWEFDPQLNRFTFVSRQAERLLGYPVSEWVGATFWPSHLHPDDRAWVVAFCEKATAEGCDHEFEYRMFAADGRIIWLRDIVTVYQQEGQSTKLRGVMIDISRQKQEEDERTHLQKRLAAVEEEERRRIAAELHDRMGEALSRVRLEIEVLKNERGEGEERRVSTRRLEEMMKGLEQEIRHLVWELRPPALDKFGLVAALGNYIGDWSERNSVVIEFEATGFDQDDRVPPHVEAALYRVVQESLTNVLKHAQARRVGVLLFRESDHLRLIVEDDGEGFEPAAAREAASQSQSFGLIGMRERAESVGGLFALESAPGKGCAVFVSVPLEQGEISGSVREKVAHHSS